MDSWSLFEKLFEAHSVFAIDLAILEILEPNDRVVTEEGDAPDSVDGDEDLFGEGNEHVSTSTPEGSC